MSKGADWLQPGTLAHPEPCPMQASLIAEQLLQHNPEVVRLVYNKFGSAISFKPTVATVMLPEVRHGSKAVRGGG